MTTLALLFGVIALALGASLIFVVFKNKALETARVAADEKLRTLQQEAEQRFRAGEELIRQELEKQKAEVQRIGAEYQTEALRVQAETQETISTLRTKLKEFEDLADLGKSPEDVAAELAKAISDATAVRDEATQFLERARATANAEISQSVERAKEIRAQADALLSQVTREANSIVANAHAEAKQLAGDAYEAMQNKQRLEQAVIAIKNVVDGYGDRYIVPTRSLVDDLAEDFGHMEAGQRLAAAREQSRRIVNGGEAATCDYLEPVRRETAIRFVIDAFNGRVDAILTRTRHDNYGTLEQEIKDAFALVNLNGQAFKNARVLPGYLEARLQELKWAVTAQELREKEREEQRRLKEQMREEEKARREYEKVIKDAQREEELLTKALEKAREEAAKASSEQKLKLENEIATLNQKLAEAEARNQRALSMAQQTRKGNVYIISNVGSFGEDVLKIGMTRRLEPMDRVKELGDASVPFEFDVHAMIPSDDAPSLENQLHNFFEQHRVNHINYRKEFFRVPLQHLRNFLAEKRIEASFTMAADAKEYRESIRLSKMSVEEREKYWISREKEEAAKLDSRFVNGEISISQSKPLVGI